MATAPTRTAMPVAPSALQRRIVHGGLTWLDCIHPNREQIEYLHATYRFHPLHLEDVLSRSQRPKIDENTEEAYLFLVLHFPVFDPVLRVSTISEVDIFVGPSFIITTHDARLKPLGRMVQSATDERARVALMSRGPGYLLYRIIEALVNYCFPMLYRLDEQLDRLEEAMFTSNVQRTVEQLSYLRRDIISLRRIVRPNIAVVRALSARDRPFLRVDEDAYYGDLVDGLAKAWDMLEEQKEIIEGLDATLTSLTSHRINQEMKTFTLISVIILPMTLVASILGMNVFIPFSDNIMSLPISLGIMLLMALALYLYFRLRQLV